jgi:hypothetical protein
MQVPNIPENKNIHSKDDIKGLVKAISKGT